MVKRKEKREKLEEDGGGGGREIKARGRGAEREEMSKVVRKGVVQEEEKWQKQILVH